MTPTPPTRRQIDEMTRVQSEKRAENDAPPVRPPMCRISGVSFEVLQRAALHSNQPAPSAGTCITPSQGADK